MLTHRRDNEAHPATTGHVVLFAEGGNEHYGNHVWALGQDLPPVPQSVVVFCADFYDIENDEASLLVDPARIVDTAGAWDDPEFVSELWQAMEYGQIEETPGYRTSDGAVVLDATAVCLEHALAD